MKLILVGFLTHRASVTAEEADNSKASSASVLANGRWQWQTLEMTGEPTPRHETSLVECDGMFYMIGGRESRKIEMFSPVASAAAGQEQARGP